MSNDPFEYTRSRNDDPDTSKKAAKGVSGKAPSQRERLYLAFKNAGPAGLTDDEAAVKAGIPLTACYWKRCGELRQDGKIHETSEERIGFAGAPRMVSVVA